MKGKRPKKRTMIELLKWANDNLSITEPDAGEDSEYDFCRCCGNPEWKHKDNCAGLSWKAEVKELLEKNAPKMRAKAFKLQPLSEKKKRCVGCRNDYYNGALEECWHLETATLVVKKKVHINDVPPWKHTPQEMPSCYRVAKFVMIDADREY